MLPSRFNYGETLSNQNKIVSFQNAHHRRNGRWNCLAEIHVGRRLVFTPHRLGAAETRKKPVRKKVQVLEQSALTVPFGKVDSNAKTKREKRTLMLWPCLLNGEFYTRLNGRFSVRKKKIYKHLTQPLLKIFFLCSYEIAQTRRINIYTTVVN